MSSAPEADVPYTLVTAQWPLSAGAPDDVEPRGLVRPFAERLTGGRPAELTAQRWERGGRH
ncbi:hypothetical protein ACWD45_27795 [Streptomyces rubiginosohelvolus]